MNIRNEFTHNERTNQSSEMTFQLEILLSSEKYQSDVYNVRIIYDCCQAEQTEKFNSVNQFEMLNNLHICINIDMESRQR